ncbi:MAG TPA: potassium/proton antiporter [Egibacteraceae bacterium]
MSEFDLLIVVTGVLLLLGVLGSKATSRLGVPAVVVFLVIGMLAGSEGPGGIAFDNPELAQAVGVIALSFILFSGGLDTRWSDVRQVGGPAFVLATVGVAATAVITGLFAMWLLGLPPAAGMLLGAIVSSTDAAAVFSVLRSRGVALRPRLQALLEVESASNDPMAVLLTVGVIAYLGGQSTGLWWAVGFFVRQMGLGAVMGILFGRVTVWTLNRVRLDYEGLYPVLTVTAVLLSYGVTSWLGGSGILAVYVAALVLGASDFVHKQSLIEYHDGVAWFMQIVMFGVLGLLVFPSELVAVAWPALGVVAGLMFVARPVVVFGLLPRGWSVRERLMVSWVGLRGSVPIVLATFPLVAGVEHASTIFNVVFFIVLTSVLLQGTSIPWTSARLRVQGEPEPLRPRPSEYIRLARQAGRAPETMTVAPGSAADGRQIVDLGLPEGTLIVLVTRGDQYLVPQGGTVLQAGDDLLVIGDPTVIGTMRDLCSPPVQPQQQA